jgi:paraquat-inducible protein B
MIKETRKTIIGGFVAGAVALSIAGILIFGSGDFFKKTNTYVLYFENSVRGLKIGAPVLFRGVEIGKVTQITLHADTEKMFVKIPVLIETDPNQWKIVSASPMEDYKGTELLIEQGMRASLEMQSLVTGLYVIELNFHEKKPAVFRATNTTYPEIPTIQTGLSKFSGKLENLPLDELEDKLMLLITGAVRIVDSQETRDLIPNLNTAILAARKLIADVDDQVAPLSTSYIQLADNADKTVTAVSSEISGTAKAYKTLAQDLDKQVDPLVAQIRMTAESIRGGVETAQSTLEAAKGVISDDSPVFVELKKTLKELSAAARSIRIWADYLERHPEALIKGKGRR